MGTTVLDEFVLSIGIDSSKFAKGEREANDSFKKSRDEAAKTGREFEDRATGIAGSFSKMRNEVLGLLAVFTAGLGVKEFVSNIVGAGIAIDRFSKLTDMSAQELGAWRNVSERFGGTADGITSTLYGLTKELQGFTLTGQSSLVPWLRALGIGITDAHGKIKNSSALLLDLAGNKYLHTMDRARAGAILANLGLDPATINLVLQGRAALNAALADARKSAPTPQDIAATKEFNKQLESLKQESTAVGRSLFTTLFPAIQAVMGGLRAFFDFLLAHQAAAVAAFSVIAVAVTGLTVALTRLVLGGLLASAISGLRVLVGMISVISGIGPLVAALGPPVAATVAIEIAAIAALALAGYELIEHWDAVKRAWLHIWDEMRHAVGLPRLYSEHPHGTILSTAPGGYSVYRGTPVDTGGATQSAPSSLLGLVRSLESSGDSAVSPAGAIGRYQVMPGTARQYGFDPSRLTDPAYNSRVATAVLNDLMGRYHGNIRDVLVAYNAGPGRANRFIAGGRDVASLPLETQRYLAHAGSLGYGGALPIIPSVPKLAVASVHHHSVRTSSTEVHIGTVAVNAPQAKDAHGIAGSIVPALERHIYASQANSGMA